ncbi:MAG: GNAT family N-acetyltransferase [Muribaculaceae bacterium]|jgi:GNAT superfamily N-acetyltransferase|nr:GNAT family N-acetyltransferase [Muribaculaceae bacterium]
MKAERLIIHKAEIGEIDILMSWRMEVLNEVFSIPVDEDTSQLYSANRNYYMKEIPSGGHIACFASIGGDIIGCGGICLYKEMPSPDNHTGNCAYLMNVYVRSQYRGRGYGKAVASWLISQAKDLGITKIYLETSDIARQMYEQLGFSVMKGYLKL